MSRTQINDKELPNDSSFVIFVYLLITAIRTEK